MIVNLPSKIGVCQKSISNEQGLTILDFNTLQRTQLEDYIDWGVSNISPNGERIAITTISSNTRGFRTDLVVLEHKRQNVLLKTHDYFVYDTAFNTTGEKILVVAEKKKPFCFDLTLNQITAELPKQIRAYKGDIDMVNDTFIAPCERSKDTFYSFDFKTGTTHSGKLGTKAKISRIKFSVDASYMYVITESNVLYCFDRSLKKVWSTDFNVFGRDGGRINPSEIFSSEDGKYLGLHVASFETSNWGGEHVVDSSDGKVLRQIEGFQFRGRPACNFFDNRILLHTFQTINLATGEFSDTRVI